MVKISLLLGYYFFSKFWPKVVLLSLLYCYWWNPPPLSVLWRFYQVVRTGDFWFQSVFFPSNFPTIPIGFKIPPTQYFIMPILLYYWSWVAMKPGHPGSHKSIYSLVKYSFQNTWKNWQSMAIPPRTCPISSDLGSSVGLGLISTRMGESTNLWTSESSLSALRQAWFTAVLTVFWSRGELCTFQCLPSLTAIPWERQQVGHHLPTDAVFPSVQCPGEKLSKEASPQTAKSTPWQDFWPQKHYTPCMCCFWNVFRFARL